MGALALGGQQLMGQTVMVKSSEAEKNLAWEAAQVTPRSYQTSCPPAFLCSLYASALCTQRALSLSHKCTRACA
jgi:hypothetical protein